jgi:hypothetical protein
MLNIFCLSVVMLSVVMLNVFCPSVVMLSVVMLSVVMLSVVKMSVFLLSVVAPLFLFDFCLCLALNCLTARHLEFLCIMI